MLKGTVGLSSFVLSKSTLPFIIAPTGTMANNGAITLGTAAPTIYSNAFIFLPAGAIAAGVPAAAAWLFCQMSSTTVGVVFNNTYTSGLPTIPSSPTAFVTTGPGAYTGVTSAVQGPTITIPGGLLGINGILRSYVLWSTTNNVNVKTGTLSIGGTSFLSVALASLGGSNSLNMLYYSGLYSFTSRGGG